MVSNSKQNICTFSIYKDEIDTRFWLEYEKNKSNQKEAEIDRIKSNFCFDQVWPQSVSNWERSRLDQLFFLPHCNI